MSQSYVLPPLLKWSATFCLLSLALMRRFDLAHWLLPAVIADLIFVATIGFLPRSALLGPNLTRLPKTAAQRNEVALTFDDGPDPQVTPSVLAVLRERGVSATFFCIGERVAAHPELCRQILAEGHAVENHGQKHRVGAAFSLTRGWRREVGEGMRTIERICGRRPQFFRPIAGLRNPLLDPVLHRLNVRLASWTRRGFDTRCNDAHVLVRRLTKHLAAGDILLLHDGNSARTRSGQPIILTALPLLLDELARRHLTPVHLSVACKPN